MDNITISAQLANAILQYLSTKPYMEVAQFIAAIQEAAKPKKEE